MTVPHAEALHACAPAGAREVVSFRAAGNFDRADIVALHLGERIDTRSLGEMPALQAAGPREPYAVFVFRFGMVVMIGTATSQAEQAILAWLAPHVIDPFPAREAESATIIVKPGAEEEIDAQGHIRLSEASEERLMLAATALARSAALGRDEAGIAEAFNLLEPVIAELRFQGRTRLSIRMIMRHIGDVLATRHRVTGRVQASEKPDLLWDHPELDRLYARLEAEFELVDRTHMLERKLEMIGSLASLLLDLVQERRSVRLELAIIGLIAFEIVLILAEMWNA